MLYALGVLIFAAGLLLSIALHEIGHLTWAKRFGVKVTQYMVGFGPTAWSRKIGETEYGVKWLPLGGYIRMIGMVPPRADGSRSRWPRRLATAVEEFRKVSRAEVQPGDEEREFYRLTPGKKMIVMLGGPMMNLLIFLVITVVLLTTLGMEHSKPPTLQINAVEQCVVPVDSPAAQSGTCPKDAPAAPASGKLEPGDTILAVNGAAVSDWNALVDQIEPAAGRPLDVLLRRQGQERTVRITPATNQVCANRQCTKTKAAGFIGIEPVQPHYFQAVPIAQVPGQVGDQLGQALSAVGRYPAKIVNLWQSVFDNKPRDVNGVIGVVGIGRLGGDVASTHALDVQEKTYMLFGLLAGVNLILFLLNLLPLLPLDGGHVAGALFEAAKRGWARLRERRRRRGSLADVPGRVRKAIYVDTAQMLPIMYGVASILVLVTLLSVYADIVKPVKLFGG